MEILHVPRALPLNIRSIVEEADKLISENSSTDSKVNREDACKIMLGLTHSWRREVVPPASTWSLPVVGVSEMRNEAMNSSAALTCDTFFPCPSNPSKRYM